MQKKRGRPSTASKNLEKMQKQLHRKTETENKPESKEEITDFSPINNAINSINAFQTSESLKKFIIAGLDNYRQYFEEEMSVFKNRLNIIRKQIDNAITLGNSIPRSLSDLEVSINAKKQKLQSDWMALMLELDKRYAILNNLAEDQGEEVTQYVIVCNDFSDYKPVELKVPEEILEDLDG